MASTAYQPLEATDVVLDDADINMAAGNQLRGDEDISSLPRVAATIPRAAWFIIVMEFCERFAYYGGTQVFQNYLQFPAPSEEQKASGGVYQTGALGLGQSAATGLNQWFGFLCYMTPILGAVLSDQYLGKYRTIFIFSIVYLIGWALLTLSTLPAAAEYNAALPAFLVCTFIIAIGAGGIKSIVSPMAAEQFPSTEPEVKWEQKSHKGRQASSQRRVVVDPDMSVQHLYNWFYWAINIGALLGGILAPKLEQHYGFAAAFFFPTIMFVLGLVVFVGGRRDYVQRPVEGSVVLKAWRCFMAGMPDSPPFTPQTEVFTRRTGSDAITWDAEFAAELRQTLMGVKVGMAMTAYWVAYNQAFTNLISQAAEMQRPDFIPNDLMANFDPLCLVTLIPIMDHYVFPFFARRGLEFYAIRRITVGFFIAALAMFWSAWLQVWIDANPLNTVSVFWQIPSYALIAISEIFSSIASYEYAFSHAPKSMKSVVYALSCLPCALAALIGVCLAPFARKEHITALYVTVGLFTAVSGVLFYVWFWRYDQMDLEHRFNKWSDKKGGADDAGEEVELVVVRARRVRGSTEISD